MTQPIYMVVGCPGSGKSWVCAQLREQFEYVRHDNFLNTNIYISAIQQAHAKATKPLLIETPFSMSQLLEPLQSHGSKVECVFIQEVPGVIEARYRARESKIIPAGHLARQRTYAERAKAMQAFVGTSAQVLEYLRERTNDLCMRESGNGRHTLSAGSHAFAVGDTVVAVADGERGTVTDVSVVVAPVFEVRWAGGSTAIFPLDTEAVRKSWPWEAT